MISRFNCLHLLCISHSVPRTHRCPDKPDGSPTPVGWDIIQALSRKLATVSAERLTVLLNASVVKLLTERDFERHRSGNNEISKASGERLQIVVTPSNLR